MPMIMEVTRPVNLIKPMNMEGTVPINLRNMEGTRPLRGQPYPTL